MLPLFRAVKKNVWSPIEFTTSWIDIGSNLMENSPYKNFEPPWEQVPQYRGSSSWEVMFWA